jgi:hypothetical protein
LIIADIINNEVLKFANGIKDEDLDDKLKGSDNTGQKEEDGKGSVYSNMEMVLK